jgi:hypothetical protein
MSGLSQLPQYSELEPYNTPAQGMMQQQMGVHMNGLNNLSKLGRM